MRDPFPIPPIPALSRAVQPLADALAMPTLPLHIHEVVGAALLYTLIQTVVSPVLSARLFPRFYPAHHRSKKANWDTHVVSLAQSLLINALALWVMYADDERRTFDYEHRVWGYTGACGLVQALAVGYFVWDLGITLLNFDIFGLGLLAHAVSALAVYTFGFRPYLNYYSPIFILYELSTPFLNIHWFFDKLDMTGSRPQLYNGIALLVTFFLCRLVWGTWQSAIVYADMWRSISRPPSPEYLAAVASSAADPSDPHYNPMLFAGGQAQAAVAPVPVWLTLVYLASNLVLNALNWYWFVKMVAAVRKRFEPPKEEKTKKDEGAVDGVAKASALGEKEAAVRRRGRAHSIEDVVPDSEELRDGTIQ
ncbi:TLC domain-containing protein [Staphylotrichum tortipilum]|uniref:TLC domain-containing protein n=1 Tax=Staphylotrichum tortipilum TaxID=2831512 RepID=A0AAN6MKS7_9PEZI|nr:TLC domain-containing protein [Staphylotrichum longicolle]